MKFIDEATIEVKAGHGGPGSHSYRREKFVPRGGPDGGDGGRGGSVILRADPNVQTLLDFKFQPNWIADDGDGGSYRNRTGKEGADLLVKVPVGTEVFEISKTDPDAAPVLLKDLSVPNEEFVVAKAGRGGKGNSFFKTATNRSPEYAQPGEEGEARKVLLSLKLVADVGLLGFPNAGKSTLISVISEARPKIADYPFTTLVPNLGVVRAKGMHFVVADIPGLIPGASEGKGLGLKFLKHVERTRVLVHLLSPTQLDEQGEPIPVATLYNLIMHELSQFSEDLPARPQILVLTKHDLWDVEQEAEFKKQLEFTGHPVLAISAATQKGIPELVEAIATQLKKTDFVLKESEAPVDASI